MEIKLPKLRKKQSYRKGGFHTNPNISWEILVFIVLLSIAISLFYGARLYLKTSRELEVPSLPGEGRQKLIDKDRIEDTLLYFAEKEKRSEQIIAAPARVVDPSR